MWARWWRTASKSRSARDTKSSPDAVWFDTQSNGNTQRYVYTPFICAFRSKCKTCMLKIHRSLEWFCGLSTVGLLRRPPFSLPSSLTTSTGAGGEQTEALSSRCNLHKGPVSSAAKQAYIATTKINVAVKLFFFLKSSSSSSSAQPLVPHCHVIYGGRLYWMQTFIVIELV